MITNYHNQLQSWPEVSKKVEDPASVKYVFDAGSFVTLRQKAYDGSILRYVLVDQENQERKYLLILLLHSLFLTIVWLKKKKFK